MEILGPKLSDYSDKYEHAALTRDEAGVLEVRFHTGDGPLVWTAKAHDELAYLFNDIAVDRENKVVLLVGTGDSFCSEIDFSTFGLASPQDWYHIAFEGRRLLRNLLDIEVPVISAINGPATIHPEIPVLSDITIASDTTVFSDNPHFASGIVPGDGAHFVWPHLIGLNRGRYFLMTGQEIDAPTALSYGLVNEVLPQGEVLDRARVLAAQIAAKPELARRFTRILLKREMDRLLHDGLEMGFLHQAVAAMDL